MAKINQVVIENVLARVRREMAEANRKLGTDVIWWLRIIKKWAEYHENPHISLRAAEIWAKYNLISAEYERQQADKPENIEDLEIRIQGVDSE